MNQCNQCRYSADDERTAPIMWCVKNSDEAIKACEQFELCREKDDEK